VRLLADESVDGPVVAALRDAGHDVMYVAEASAGLGDDDVLDLANSHGRLLLTADRDFGTLVCWQRRSTLGVVLMRLAGLTQEQRARLVVSVFEYYGHGLLGAFTVISRHAVRIRRPMPGPQGGPLCCTS